MTDSEALPTPATDLPPFERVDPKTTRLLVIDVQNDFCARGGWFEQNGSDLRFIDRAVDNIIRFVSVARTVGIKPIFVRAIYDRIYLSPPMVERHRRNSISVEHCQTGTWGAEFFKVAPEKDDLVIVKHRYSAFIDTELNALLRAQRVENLIMAGITSNVCVESTARDGYMLDYHIVFMSDCTATNDPTAHEATLDNIRRAFGIVASMSDVIETWNRAGILPSGAVRAARARR